jgi:four helix bundle protein
MVARARGARNEILERSIGYSLRIIALYRFLNREQVGRVLGRQLLRAATSIGANAHEAQGGQSRADFISKMSIAHKEARECAYWLRLITEAKLLSPERLNGLTTETDEIVRMLASIVVTAKKLPRNPDVISSVGNVE